MSENNTMIHQPAGFKAFADFHGANVFTIFQHQYIVTASFETQEFIVHKFANVVGVIPDCSVLVRSPGFCRGSWSIQVAGRETRSAYEHLRRFGIEFGIYIWRESITDCAIHMVDPVFSQPVEINRAICFRRSIAFQNRDANGPEKRLGFQRQRGAATDKYIEFFLSKQGFDDLVDHVANRC